MSEGGGAGGEERNDYMRVGNGKGENRRGENRKVEEKRRENRTREDSTGREIRDEIRREENILSINC